MSLFDEVPVPKKLYPWMEKKRFVLADASKLAELEAAVIASGKYALDLETTGVNLVIKGDPPTTTDVIVGVCIAPDANTGYYIPVAHRNSDRNVPWEVVHAMLLRLVASGAIAIFHNAAFDQELLQFNPLGPVSDWESKDQWDDTLILAYLFNSREKRFGLKYLAEKLLDQKMFELSELFPGRAEKDFSTLDPTYPDVVHYAASDAICTFALYEYFAPLVLTGDFHQRTIYGIEKACLASTRAILRNMLPVSMENLWELINLANREILETLDELYGYINTVLGRDIRPPHLKIALGASYQGQKYPAFDPNQRDITFDEYTEKTRRLVKSVTPYEPEGTKKTVPMLTAPQRTEEVTFPATYDVASAAQLGNLLRELGVPLKISDKGNIETNSEVIDELIETYGTQFEALGYIGKYRSVVKALSTYLYGFLRHAHEFVNADGETYYAVRIGLKQQGTDTGRFAAAKKKKDVDDGTCGVTPHGIPAPKKGDKFTPKVLGQIRKVIVPRRKKAKIVSIDFSGVELRIAAAFSREPKWVDEFFRCSTCSYEFERPPENVTPKWIPSFCTRCGSDRVGDIHTLTGIQIFGEEAVNAPNWKDLRGKAKCVALDTLVCVRRGGTSEILSIGDLRPQNVLGVPEQTDSDTFQKLQGVEVLTSGGWQPATHFYDGGEKPVIQIHTDSGLSIKASHTHPIGIIDNTGRHVWREASQIQIGDTLEVMGAPAPKRRAETRAQAVADYVAGLLWRYESTDDACYLHRYLTRKTEARALLLEAGINTEVVGKKIRLVQRPSHASADLTRAIPDSAEFFSGVIDANANYRTKDGYFVFIFREDESADVHALQLLLSAMGVATRRREEHLPAGVGYNRIILSPTPSGLRAIATSLWEDLKWPKHARHTTNYYRERPIQTQVAAIIPLGSQPVVDLVVPSTASFWTQGLHSHNSTNFALAYGGSFAAVMAACGVNEQEARRIKEKFDKGYPVLQKWWTATREFARKHGFVVTAFGRRCPLPDIQLPRTDPKTGRNNGAFIAQAERNATNAPVQGTSADITKIAMIYAHRLIRERGWQGKVYMLNTIHDELVFEIDDDILEEAIDALVDVMTRNKMIIDGLKWPIPLTSDVEIGDTWLLPYNLFSMRKGEKPWPESLEPLFKNKSLTYFANPRDGGDLRVFDPTAKHQPAPAAPVPAASVSAAAPAPATPVAAPAADSTPLPASTTGSIGGERYLVQTPLGLTIRLPALTHTVLMDLAFVIDKADGTGMVPLSLALESGEDVTATFIAHYKRAVQVDAELLRYLMRSRPFE